GVPLMRAMFIEYPNDEKATELDNQFMLGEYLLVAPVVEKGAEFKNVYLPEGEWIDFHDKQTIYKGGQEIKYNAPLDVVPLFVKRGAMIPTMPVMQYIHEKEDYPVIWEVFPKQTGDDNFELYEDDGISNDYKENKFSVSKLEVDQQGNALRLSFSKKQENGYAPSQHPQFVKIHLNGKPKKVVWSGKKVSKVKKQKFFDGMSIDQNKTLWAWDEDNKVCYLLLSDMDKLEIN
ncbi:DUF5110 domain-containing protein, partial [Echinicola sediminis]